MGQDEIVRSVETDYMEVIANKNRNKNNNKIKNKNKNKNKNNIKKNKRSNEIHNKRCVLCIVPNWVWGTTLDKRFDLYLITSGRIWGWQSMFYRRKYKKREKEFEGNEQKSVCAYRSYCLVWVIPRVWPLLWVVRLEKSLKLCSRWKRRRLVVV